MSMLDLNVNIIKTNDDSTFVQKELQLITFTPQITESRTSNTFDLLKKEKDVTEFYNIERVKEGNTAQTITRNLFPVSADRGGRVYDSMNQRLNFDDQKGLRILQQKKHQVLKTRRGPRSRSSQYRGVTFYRRTGRWESHIWDCGKQVYLGGFDTAHAAARAYDRAAVMFRGVDADINFIFTDYEEDLKQMRGLSKEEFVLRLRKQTNGISRRSSTYRSALALQKYGQGDPPITPFIGKTFCHKPSTTYKGDIIANSNKACTLHNLDLSLGISPSSKILNNNDCGDGVSFGCRAGMIPKERGKMEKALVNIKRDVPFQVFSNLALQFCSNGNIALGSLQSKAASSGFVSSSTCFIAHTSNYLT